MRVVSAVVACIAIAACSSSSCSPIAPTPPPTRVIDLAGDLALGVVEVNTAAERQFTISNTQ